MVRCRFCLDERDRRDLHDQLSEVVKDVWPYLEATCGHNITLDIQAHNRCSLNWIPIDAYREVSDHQDTSKITHPPLWKPTKDEMDEVVLWHPMAGLLDDMTAWLCATKTFRPAALQGHTPLPGGLFSSFWSSITSSQPIVPWAGAILLDSLISV